MSKPILILAAHGAGDGSSHNEMVRAWTRDSAWESHFAAVAPAFKLGTPAYADVLDALPRFAGRIVVVPLMTSDGHFTRVVLPRELARNRRAADARIELTPPAGTQPEVVGIVERRVRKAALRFGLAQDGTTVVIVGHGTQRHQRSRAATETLCDALRERAVAADVRSAFLDDSPFLEDVVHHVPSDRVIVVPFLLGGGRHALGDIPRRLKIRNPNNERPCAFERDGRTIVVTAALGEGDDLLGVVQRLAFEQLERPLRTPEFAQAARRENDAITN